MHNSRWRLFLLAIIILFPGVGFSKEALTFEQALDKYSGNRGAIYTMRHHRQDRRKEGR